MSNITKKNTKGNLINKIFSNILDKISKPIDQYFPGCLTELKLPEIKEAYLKICDLLNIDLEILDDLICCGLPAKNSGNDYHFLIDKRKKQIKEYKINKIFSNCPSCVYNLQKDGFNAEPILKIIYKELLNKEQENQTEKQNKKLGLVVTFHDPCHMGRYLGEYELPRKILKLIGCEIKEMEHNKESSMCCGAGGGLINNNPKLATKIGMQRIKEAEQAANILVTCCPLCYLQLKSISDQVTKHKIQVFEISELILKYLNTE